MTETWIKTALAPLLWGDTAILLEQVGDCTIGCTISQLVSMFGGLATVDYAALSRTPQAASWQKYFDDWKTKGYIS